MPNDLRDRVSDISEAFYELKDKWATSMMTTADYEAMEIMKMELSVLQVAALARLAERRW